MGWAQLVLLLLLPSMLGSVAGVVAVLLAVPLAFFVGGRGAWGEVHRQPAMLLFLGVFVALGAAYAVTARNPGNMLYLASFLALPLALPIYLLAARFRGRHLVLLVAALAALGACICAVVAANDVFLRGLPRAAGFIMGGNLLARIAVTLAFIGLAGLFATGSGWRLLLYLGPLAATVVVLLTETRGAALALPVVALVLGAFLAADRRNHAQLWLLLALGVAVAALFLLSVRFGGISTVIAEVLTSGGASSDSSTAERLEMFAVAMEAFRAAPWLGYGWANLAPAAAQFIDMTPHGGREAGHFQFHSDVANFAVAAGILGLLCLLALLAGPVVGALATPRDPLFRTRLYCCLQLSLAYAVFGLTDLQFGYDLSTTLYAFLTAAILGGFRPAPAAGTAG